MSRDAAPGLKHNTFFAQSARACRVVTLSSSSSVCCCFAAHSSSFFSSACCHVPVGCLLHALFISPNSFSNVPRCQSGCASNSQRPCLTPAGQLLLHVHIHTCACSFTHSLRVPCLGNGPPFFGGLAHVVRPAGQQQLGHSTSQEPVILCSIIQLVPCNRTRLYSCMHRTAVLWSAHRVCVHVPVNLVRSCCTVLLGQANREGLGSVPL